MKKSFYLASSIVLAFSLSACVSSSSDTPVLDNLPAVTGVKTLAGMRSVGFEWEPLYDINVDGFKIYRTQMGDEPGAEELIASINDRYTTHFLDEKLQPESKYMYTIVAFNKQGVSRATTVNVNTAARIDPVPFVQAITGLPNKIKIIWRPHPDTRVVKYYVYKQRANSDKWNKIATVKGRLSAEYIDNIKPNEFAKYKISAVTYHGVESVASDTTQAVSKTLPPSVSTLIATTNLPKRVLLSWDAPEYEDFHHFNIYSSKSKLLPFLKLVETTQNSYEHVLGADGVVREYYVTMVDKDGLESPRPQVNATGSSLPKPKAPVLTGYKIISDGRIEISWYAQDDRAKSYAVFKNGEQIATSAAGMYVDASYEPGDRYQVVAIDEYGIASDASSKLSVSQ